MAANTTAPAAIEIDFIIAVSSRTGPRGRRANHSKKSLACSRRCGQWRIASSSAAVSASAPTITIVRWDR
jgi:hypothetical protein